MLCILLFLSSYDSLPPLPDLSKLSFPEPALWTEPIRRGIRVNAFAGQFYGAELDLNLHSLLAEVYYVSKNDWDSTDAGSIDISYKTMLPRLWVDPKARAQLLRRQDEYMEIAPGLDFVLFTSPFVVSGDIEYSNWFINREHSTEANGELSLIFDRIDYLPGITLNGVYTAGEAKPNIFFSLHLRSIHVAVGSAIKTGFPSPKLEIAYKEPWVEVAAGVQTGVKHNTLTEYFDPDLPVKYRIDIPSETLRVGLKLQLRLNTGHQQYTVSSSYIQWLHRLTISDDYEISYARDITETNIRLSAKNRLRIHRAELGNTIHFEYNKTDSTIPFLPDIAVSDTLHLSIGIVELAADLRHVAQRDGIRKTLQRYSTVNTTLGLRLSPVKIYVAIRNITDDNSEIYDDYWLKGRQYAGGIEIEQRF